MMRNSFATGLLVAVLSTVALANAAEPAPPVAVLSAGRGLLEWIPLVESEEMTLALADPRGVVRTHLFSQGSALALSLFDTQGAPLPDGTYTWELRATPRGSAPLVQSGYFTISGGHLVAPDLAEPPAQNLRSATAPDQMVPDDLIIDGKGCIGLGCVNNEAFGAEALRLKQSVVRLRFQDTSTSASFPANDWQITVNDAANGGLNRFSIEDVDGNKTPLTIRAGAPDNSVYVDSAGRIGIGTATPAERLHVLESSDANTLITSENANAGLNAAGALRAKSDSAIVNFQAHGSGRTLSRFGQPLASWAEFLQVTGNGLIIGTIADKPLILGTNNTNRLHIAPNGSIGIGTAAPEVPLHVVRNAGALTNLLRLSNNGGIQFLLDRTDPGANDWQFSNFNQSFQISVPGTPTGQFTLVSNGDLQISNRVFAVAFIPSSARDLKEDFAPVDGRDVLARLAAMPVTEWSFRSDPTRQRHIGPVAEDFQAAFGLGQEGKGLNLTDVNGVTIAALQGLHATVEEQRQVIDMQQQLIEKLEERLKRLETQEQPAPGMGHQP